MSRKTRNDRQHKMALLRKLVGPARRNPSPYPSVRELYRYLQGRRLQDPEFRNIINESGEHV